MSEALSIIKHGPTKEEIIQREIDQLEKELMELGSVAESQVAYKKAAIEKLKEQLEEERARKTKGFNNAKMGLESKMAENDMFAAMAQGQGRG
ncbi:MAG: hypothetical protein E7006_01020 [Alphaproteobacteria bacterium]|nr:hypothetical protein [Alphaproteobacteria bacterium]